MLFITYCLACKSRLGFCVNCENITVISTSKDIHNIGLHPGCLKPRGKKSVSQFSKFHFSSSQKLYLIACITK